MDLLAHIRLIGGSSAISISLKMPKKQQNSKKRRKAKLKVPLPPPLSLPSDIWEKHILPLIPIVFIESTFRLVEKTWNQTASSYITLRLLIFQESSLYLTIRGRNDLCFSTYHSISQKRLINEGYPISQLSARDSSSDSDEELYLLWLDVRGRDIFVVIISSRRVM
jgi:hypothetical protein